MNDFFPSADYKMPTSSNYMKFLEGENSFRVLGSAIVGFEYWTTQNKPIRNKENWDEKPEDIKQEKDGSYRINHFWAFPIWNYEEKRIQILELTQKSIMKPMQALIKNPKWGDPKKYDITVTKSGSGFETEYQVVPNPHSLLDANVVDQYTNKKIKLDALYDGKDPFSE